MTLSQRIRAAALGPTPHFDLTIGNWLGWNSGAHLVAFDLCELSEGQPVFRFGTDTERRFFLLFVAEALENPND